MDILSLLTPNEREFEHGEITTLDVGEYREVVSVYHVNEGSSLFNSRRYRVENMDGETLGVLGENELEGRT